MSSNCSIKYFLDSNYLKTGTLVQQKAYNELTYLGIFKKLKRFNPILAGTIPIDISIKNSDLDIICNCEDHQAFTKILTDLYGNEKHFKVQTKQINTRLTTIAKFQGKNFPVEIFGQNIPSKEQDAVKHLLIECLILKEKGEYFKKRIIQLKKTGLKTEPAFAQLLKLKGNPYQELLSFIVFK
jgi:hypothetical protein